MQCGFTLSPASIIFIILWRNLHLLLIVCTTLALWCRLIFYAFLWSDKYFPTFALSRRVLPFCYVRLQGMRNPLSKLPTCNCQGRTELLFYQLRCTNCSLFFPRGAKDISMLNLHTCNICQVCSSTPLHLSPFMHSSAWFLSVRQRKRAVPQLCSTAYASRWNETFPAFFLSFFTGNFQVHAICIELKTL